MIAVKLTALGRGGDRGNQYTGGKPSIEGLPIENAAERLSVSLASVERAKKVQTKGAPELRKAVEAGKVSVNAAAT